MVARKKILRTMEERGIDASAYQVLVEHGRRMGRLSRDEVADVIPDAEFDGPLAEEFVHAIAGEGIEVVDPEVLEDEETFPGEGDALADLSTVEVEARDINLSGVEVDDVLRIYLQEATQVPLLTAQEEVELARRIELCRRAYEELSRGNVAPQRQEELQRIIENGRLARDRLIRANARLVVSVARRYSGRGMPLSDLIQEGNIGLMRAIRNFDYRRGFKFSTYATWWIRQAISRALADQSRTIRLPAYMSDQITRLRRVQLQLQQRLNRAPSYQELGEAMGMPADKIEQMIGSMAHPVSLEAPVTEESDADLGDMLEDVNALNPEDAVMDSMDSEVLRERLAVLPPREMEVIQLRFGLGEEGPLTLSEVGQRLGITRERVRQLEMQALERMRNPEQAAKRKRRGPAAKTKRERQSEGEEAT